MERTNVCLLLPYKFITWKVSYQWTGNKTIFSQKSNDPGLLVACCAAVVSNAWAVRRSGHSLFVWWMNYKFSAKCDGCRFSANQILIDGVECISWPIMKYQRQVIDYYRSMIIQLSKHSWVYNTINMQICSKVPGQSMSPYTPWLGPEQWCLSRFPIYKLSWFLIIIHIQIIFLY